MTNIFAPRKPAAAAPPGLTAVQLVLLNSQIPGIGSALRGKSLKTEGEGWRGGSSLQIRRRGWWRDKAGQRGHRTLALIQQYHDGGEIAAIASADLFGLPRR